MIAGGRNLENAANAIRSDEHEVAVGVAGQGVGACFEVPVIEGDSFRFFAGECRIFGRHRLSSGAGSAPDSIKAMMPMSAPHEWKRSDESRSSSPVPVIDE